MKKKSAIPALITGASLLLWWWSYTLFLPFKQVSVSYATLINHPAWIPVNSLEVLMVISWMIFLLFYATGELGELGKRKAFMMVFMVIGLFVYSGVAFYEAILWPIIAPVDPDLLSVTNGPIYTSTLFMVATSLGILSFGIGNMMLGATFYRRHGKGIGLVVLLGTFLLCTSYFSGPIRYFSQTAGITLLGVGYFWLGVKLYNEQESVPENL
ncbi:MAG TPA: hypothetical protein PLK12_03720 [Prolixibacteraceae bacterium]|nr:hypothetical protein [Prolixibacteraceae bacterium]